MKKIAILSIAAIAGAASADSTFVDLSGLASIDDLGFGGNVVLTIPLSPGATVDSIDWDYLYSPVSPSWTDEPNIQYSDTAQTSVYNWDGGDWGGTSSSTPFLFVGSDTVGITVGGDGLLRIELWEDFVDFDGVPDGFYDGGVTVNWTPAPGSLAILGLGGLVATRRRR